MDKRKSFSTWHSHSDRVRRSVGLWWFVVLGCCCFVHGCDSRPGESTTGPPAGSQRLDDAVRIVVIGEAQEGPAWELLVATCKHFDEQYANVTVDVLAPPTLSPLGQRELLHDVSISSGAGRTDQRENVNAICIMPTDPVSILTTIKEASITGIPIVTIGRDVPDSGRSIFCGPSRGEIGQAAAQACGEAVRGRSPRIMLLHAGEKTAAYAACRNAFKAELPVVGNVELMREIDCRGNKADALRLVKFEAKRYPRVGCWVFLDDWPLRLLDDKERLLPLGCGMVLCNGSPRYTHQLRDGRISAMITYDLHTVVRDALYIAWKLTAPKPPRITLDRRTVPAEIITSRNVDEYDARWSAWRRGQSGTTKPASPNKAS